MRRLLPLALVALFALAASIAAGSDDPTTERIDPKLPNAPGPFHAYNITGKFKGRYHSQISDFGLEPTVMVFTREVEFSDALKSLLKQIDAAIEKNPTARLHAFVVVQSDDLPEVVGADDKTDDKRLEITSKLEDQAKGLMTPHIDIVLAGAADLAKYKLDDVGFAFYLFQRAKVTASSIVKKDDKLSDAVAMDVMKALVEKGGAVRK
jgi:hypothetical protein